MLSRLHGSAARAAKPRKLLAVRGADLPRTFAESAANGPPSGVTLPITFADIARARARITGGVVQTRCYKSEFLSDQLGMDLYLKLEMTQKTGSFKERGARNAMMALTPEAAAKGAVAASAGNHALALAYHGRELGIPVTVCMPTVAPLAKQMRARKLGAEVIVTGNHILEAKQFADEHHAEKTYINGFDHPDILAGAGTMGVEIAEDVPDVEAVVIPTGGAGLLAGTALALKTLVPDAKVYAVEPELCASFKAAVDAGYPVDFPSQPTLADGLAVPKVGANAFEVARWYTDEIVAVKEHDVAIAVLRILETEKLVVEGGGAIGLSPLLPGAPLHEKLQGKRVVIPLCGGNIDSSVLGRVIDRGLAADGRLVRFTVQVSDRPGGLNQMLGKLADNGMSVWDVSHERAWLRAAVDRVLIKVIGETTDADHAQKIYDVLIESGYSVKWENVGACESTGMSTDW